VRRQRYSEEQIIGILKEAEAGVPLADLVRKHGISTASFYAWRKKYGGMEVSDAKKLRALEDENRRLKKLVADLSLDNQLLKEISEKNGDACSASGGCAVASPRARYLGATCLQADELSATDQALPVGAHRARGSAPSHPRYRLRTAPLRHSSCALVGASARLRGGASAGATHLPRGRPRGP
jgi:putative transposase